MSYVKIGVAGPVGSGKTALIEALTRRMAKDYSIGVITNDIYTKEDAEFLAKNSVMPRERIIGVETGGCPHTAIREDASMNLEAVDEMMEKFPDIELLFIESGGDNLSATFSPELVDATIFVIDVAEEIKSRAREVPASPAQIFSSSIRPIWLPMSAQAWRLWSGIRRKCARAARLSSRTSAGMSMWTMSSSG